MLRPVLLVVKLELECPFVNPRLVAPSSEHYERECPFPPNANFKSELARRGSDVHTDTADTGPLAGY